MAVLGTSRRSWKYTDDDGNTYRVSAEADLVSQADVGGSAIAGTEPNLPPRFRMRKRYVSNGSVTRAVTCYDTACALWTTPGTTVNLMLNSVSVSFAATDTRLGEKENKRRVTSQTA